jgi:hypothetical protein
MTIQVESDEPLARDIWCSMLSSGHGLSVTPYAHPDWVDYQARTIPRAVGASLLLTLTDGSRVGVPLLRVRDSLGFHSHWALGHDEYSALLANEPLSPARRDAVYRYLARVRRPIRVTLAPERSEPQWAPGEPWGIDEYTTHVLDLPSSYDAWFRSAAQTCRANIKRADKSGLVLSAANTPENVSAYYALYEMSTKRWSTAEKTRHHKDYFERLAACPLTRLLIAYKNGEPAAGFITLEFGGYIVYYQGALNWSFTQYRPTYFGLSELIRGAIDRGVTTLNFGSSLGIESLERFKRNFGATRFTYHTHHIHDTWTRLRRAARYYRSRIDAALSSSQS